MKPVTSPPHDFIKQDYERWLRNTLVFFAPALLVFLRQLLIGSTLEQALPILHLWLINTLIDLTTKWIGENTYK